MNKFDVLIVGAGPGGGHCARLLAKKGHRVLLIERYKDFSRNNFSSAGTPKETLRKYDLPESLVGSWWNKFVVVTTHRKRTWQSKDHQGCVLDFEKMRQFLANEVSNYGGEVWLGCRYIDHLEKDGILFVTLKNNLTNTTIEVMTDVLVDATGSMRRVMHRKKTNKPPLVTATGVEYLIEVDETIYNDHAKALTFLLGHQWMPKGYSWVFPMEQNILKVGAGVYHQNHKLIQEAKPLSYYIDLLIRDYLQAKNYQLLDIHGETLKYSSGLQDIYSDGKIIAIGDVVSTVNWLGGEGIRHAMESAEIAHTFICQVLEGKRNDFDGYQKQMHTTFLSKWNMCEKLANKKYTQDTDELVSKVFSYLEGMELEDVVDVLFYYKFEKISKGLTAFILKKIKSFFLPKRE